MPVVALLGPARRPGTWNLPSVNMRHLFECEQLPSALLSADRVFRTVTYSVDSLEAVGTMRVRSTKVRTLSNLMC